MTSRSELRALAAAKYPDYKLDLEDGQPEVSLKSIMDLDSDELRQFNESQKRLTSSDESDDLLLTREEFISLLAGVSSDKARTAASLEGETLGYLTILFEQYSTSLKAEEATKS